jgi:hypothetical protein
VTYRTFDTVAARPPRRWPIVLPLALVVVLAAAWSGFWYYAAGRAETELAAWRAREAAAGRDLSCGAQSFAGFPFRFELRCAEPALGLPKARLSLKAREMLAAVQVYQPTLLIAEFGGPLAITDEGRGERFTLGWSLAQASVRGVPQPERVALVLDKPALARAAGAAEALANAEHLEFHLRQAPRLTQDPPVLDLALSVVKALVPAAPRVPNVPIDAEIAGTLRGLNDLAPKPWPQLLRELQAANGRLDVTKARIQQGDILGTGSGTLSLTARGTLDGQLQLTIAGIEQLVTLLGVDKAVGQASQKALDRYAPGLNLDRLLGSRGNAALAAAGAAMLGQPAELEGRKAVTLPLRFADGVVFLGPLRVGEIAPLF